jgi:hypothetical protein
MCYNGMFANFPGFRISITRHHHHHHHPDPHRPHFARAASTAFHPNVRDGPETPLDPRVYLPPNGAAGLSLATSAAREAVSNMAMANRRPLPPPRKQDA